MADFVAGKSDAEFDELQSTIENECQIEKHINP